MLSSVYPPCYIFVSWFPVHFCSLAKFFYVNIMIYIFFLINQGSVPSKPLQLIFAQLHCIQFCKHTKVPWNKLHPLTHSVVENGRENTRFQWILCWLCCGQSMLRYRTDLLKFLETLLFLPVFLSRAAEQKQMLEVELFSDYTDDPVSLSLTVFVKVFAHVNVF